MRSLSVVIPVYNEEQAIESTIRELTDELIQLNVEYEVICVDDGSKDKSYELLLNLEKENKMLKVIKHPYNMGYGAALKTGIKNSLYEWILIIDADNSYPPRELPALISYWHDYDVIIGARVKKGVKVPIGRRFPKWILNKFASYLAGLPIPDLNSGFRVFKKEIALKYWHLFPRGFSFTSTLTMAATMELYKVKFVPISYQKRRGKSSINPLRDTIKFFALILSLTAHFNPLKVFLPLSIVCFLLCIARGIRDVIIASQLGGLCLILFILSIQFFFFGLILDILNKSIVKSHK